MDRKNVELRLGLSLLAVHQFLYERSGGRYGARLGWLPILLLRTRGRRSGQTRTAALTYVRDGDAYAVVGSKGGSDSPPAWLLNLEAQPEVEVQVGTRAFPARARIATAAEQRRLWARAVELWPGYAGYQRKTERKIPIVLLEPATSRRPSSGKRPGKAR